MCGFIYQRKKKLKFKLSKNLFKSASKLIYHRGPDNKNYVFDEFSHIFHSRLKIIDLLDRSNQPMTRYGYTIIFNGEIYNFEKIKKELKRDFKFSTNSDTEVLLFSFIKWREKMFDKLNGMYSFIIYNNSKNLIFCARDLFGQKPLYFSNNKDQIIFSSEIKPILKLIKSSKLKLEDKEINKYLNFNYYGESNLTFFKEIYQLQPGSFGYFKKNKLIIKKIKCKNSVRKIDTKYTLNTLKNEISDHLVSDVEMAIMISDGVDSKSILDITRKIFKKNLKLFNLNFEKYDNNIFQKKYSKIEKKNLFVTKFLKKEMFNFLNKTSLVCEAPPLSLFNLGLMKLFKKIKLKNIKVVLNGQGIDEVFGGYNIKFITQNHNKRINPDGKVFLKDKDIYLKKIMKLKKNNNFKEQRKNLIFKSKIPKNLCQYDKISMKYSIECRSPYLTKNLANFIDKLKLNQLYSKNYSKYIFRKTMFNLTKDDFYFRKKNFYQSPQDAFMKEPRNLMKIEKIIKGKNYCDKYFNKNKLLNYLEDFKKSKNNGFVIWQYISLNSLIDNFNKFILNN